MSYWFCFSEEPQLIQTVLWQPIQDKRHNCPNSDKPQQLHVSLSSVSEIQMYLFTKRLTGEEDLILHNQVIKDFIFEPQNSMTIH